ncbi:MAG: hypothetical protein JW850_22980 [Thermoflexales bacterium]|nr:hypothetical protein [Thermoflexales bacterium]
MTITIERIAELERANYIAMFPMVGVTPGMDLIVRDDIILTSNEILPMPDSTHACLLRATPETADDLICQVIDYFKSKKLPTLVFVSPACTPPELPERLLRHGFVKQKQQEHWIVFEHALSLKLPDADPRVIVERATAGDALTFAHTFALAFELPPESAPQIAQLLRPSIDLAGNYHYLAFVDKQPVATLSLICHENIGVIGSGGVIPGHRGGRLIASLCIQAVDRTRREHPMDTVIGQTTEPLVQRLLRISGFKTAFSRTCYSLP